MSKACLDLDNWKGGLKKGTHFYNDRKHRTTRFAPAAAFFLMMNESDANASPYMKELLEKPLAAYDTYEEARTDIKRRILVCQRSFDLLILFQDNIRENAENMVSRSSEKIKSPKVQWILNTQYLLSSSEPERQKKNLTKPRYSGRDSGSYLKLIYLITNTF